MVDCGFETVNKSRGASQEAKGHQLETHTVQACIGQCTTGHGCMCCQVLPRSGSDIRTCIKWSLTCLRMRTTCGQMCNESHGLLTMWLVCTGGRLSGMGQASSPE